MWRYIGFFHILLEVLENEVARWHQDFSVFDKKMGGARCRRADSVFFYDSAIYYSV